jgi:hypothetical protein
MIEIDGKDREMENLDFRTIKNFKSKKILDYIVRQKVWITKENFKTS